jgi:hypothetical protein
MTMIAIVVARIAPSLSSRGLISALLIEHKRRAPPSQSTGARNSFVYARRALGA